MGQRTQMLFRVTDTKSKKVLFSVVYHYQWGFGRVMLMDMLHLAISTKVTDKVRDLINVDKRSKRDLLQAKMNLFTKINEQCADRPYYDDSNAANAYQDTKDKSKYLLEDEQDLFGADNNNGWAIIDEKMNSDQIEPDITFSFYQNLPGSQRTAEIVFGDVDDVSDEEYLDADSDIDCFQCSLEQYVYWGEGLDYADHKFVKDYRTMLQSYRINEAEVKKPVNTDFIVPGYNKRYPSYTVFYNMVNNK